MDFDLRSRAGLPEHLRYLADKYPREMWTGHPNFNGLTSFWLDRHLMFRNVQERMQQETKLYLDRNADARQFGQNIYRLAGFFINELHGHHNIEDAHYFPMLCDREKRLKEAFELLDADHHAMDGLLADLTGHTNALLQALAAGKPARNEAGVFHRSVDAFAGFLDRHLADEEEIVVPVILEHAIRD
ncbi:hemerythrin domain-containing protein [Halovulum dunhuangense]|uniref:Hemerythrin domain-containing protein n=1 Tax=Halovulum dunhuangense TaxID=1505036 RepID=A0A849L048_9RHOB|nr:hemerythrin domain-containing protein [Halovulum dunhuangense]NNU79160.1 hemerythrin domain-containing protein [Halovulum dunhuangense]